MGKITELQAKIPAALAGMRLDQALAEIFPDYSRSRLQQWIRAGEVAVDGLPGKAKVRITGGEEIHIRAELREESACEAQDIPLRVIYEDKELLVIDKPAGLVVHPAAGNPHSTLQNALLFLDPSLVHIPRSGIVHRLDKETSGLLVVARTLKAHHALVAQLQARSVSREYDAVVYGVMTAGGTVDAAIGRHPVDRKRMAVVHNGKPAKSHYRVVERYRAHSQVRVALESGRTHQIRVHMAHIRYPLVGDPVYGGRLRMPAGVGENLRNTLQNFKRQALHAASLRLLHPHTGETVQWQAPWPEDFRALVATLREDAANVDPGAAG